jgi:hypothetical protein
MYLLRLVGHVARVRETRKTYRIFVWNYLANFPQTAECHYDGFKKGLFWGWKVDTNGSRSCQLASSDFVGVSLTLS